MTQPYVQKRNENETLVISRTDEGFRVFSPPDSTKSNFVGGGPDSPTCTCPDFQQGDPQRRCKHIQAVERQLGIKTADASATPSYEAEERSSIRHENEGPVDLPPPQTGSSEMVIKRSVSPDGRIDSLSVEFTCPVGEMSANEIVSRAVQILGLQSEIVGSFLAENGNGNGQRAIPQNGSSTNGAAPAQMLTIGGLNTKWGRRLFISFQTNGQTVKLFGSRKQLADAIVAAGFPNLAERVDEGKQLNVPCRVRTKPSEDGKYINVEQVLPAERGQQRGW